MANGWTPERRARQSELIRSWRPWEKSTGPSSARGKSVVPLNAYGGGHWKELREMIETMNATLREQRRLVESISR